MISNKYLKYTFKEEVNAYLNFIISIYYRELFLISFLRLRTASLRMYSICAFTLLSSSLAQRLRSFQRSGFIRKSMDFLLLISITCSIKRSCVYYRCGRFICAENDQQVANHICFSFLIKIEYSLFF